MDDLISRAAALEAISNEGGCGMCTRRVLDIPAVDAVPVVHGRWIEHKDEHQCSECSEFTIVDFYVWKNMPFDYCPNCGAKMEGGASDDPRTSD